MKVTFKPLSGGRYRCNQTGMVMTQRQILSYVNGLMHGNDHVSVGYQPPQKNKKTKHRSQYRRK